MNMKAGFSPRDAVSTASRMLRALSLLFLIGLAACAADPPTPGPLVHGCTMTRRAELDLHMSRNFMLAPVRLNGMPALLLVDTGAEASTLTPEAAAALHLPRDPKHNSVLIGISGPIRTENVRLHQLVVGDVERRDQSVGVGQMPAFPGQHPAVAGLLGADLLSAYDVDIDVPNRRMTLYSPVACDGFRPWPDAMAVPLMRTRSGLSFVDATVDGRAVRALVDTGARTTLISRHTASLLGVTDAELARDPERRGMGIGRGGIEFRQHLFNELGLPGAMGHDVVANVADLQLPGVQMLLGADYLGARRIWISYSTGRLFLR
jgi:predicted aspartyl protease